MFEQNTYLFAGLWCLFMVHHLLLAFHHLSLVAFSLRWLLPVKFHHQVANHIWSICCIETPGTLHEERHVQAQGVRKFHELGHGHAHGKAQVTRCCGLCLGHLQMTIGYKIICWAKNNSQLHIAKNQFRGERVTWPVKSRRSHLGVSRFPLWDCWEPCAQHKTWNMSEACRLVLDVWACLGSWTNEP